MKLHLLSDLHLSLGTLAIPQTDADVVILAGDIARPREAIAWALAFAKPVLYVPGNHEFYGGSIVGTVDELKQLCAGTNVRVLDNDQVIVDCVRFLGTTLWTDFMLSGDVAKQAEAMQEGLAFMRDFSRIRSDKASDALFAPADSAALFNINAAWLDKRLAEPWAGPTVVITHHAPSPRSIHPRFAGSVMNACFVSDAERLIDGDRVKLWIHGHTHDSFDYVLNGTRVVCNPRGYAKDGVNENPLFNPTCQIEIE